MDTAAGQIVALRGVVDVADRLLSITLEDLGGADPRALIAGLSIERRDAGLVAHFTFDEGTGGTAVNTSPHGTDHTGTLVDDATWTSLGLDGAVSFDGDMVAVPSSPDINRGIHQTLTISAWFLVEDATIDARKQVIYERTGH